MTTAAVHTKAFLAASLVLCPSLAWAEAPTEAITRYLEVGRAVVAELNTDSPNATMVVDSITAMLEDAKPVATAFGEKHTQCIEQLAKMIELFPQLDVWTAQEIRRNIETGAALPRASGCYAARDIVAHPAIVRSIARNGIQPGQGAQLNREMDEAIEHMEAIAAELQ